MFESKSRHAPLDRPHASKHLKGVLCVPDGAYGVALIVRGAVPGGLASLSHGLADMLRRARLATCVVDLLDRNNPSELAWADDLELLEDRVAVSIQYLATSPRTRHLPLGLVADGAPATAAVRVATRLETHLQALTLWCPRWSQDLHDASQLITPTVLVVPGRDRAAIEENERAFRHLTCPSQMAVILGARCDFAQPGVFAAGQLVVQEWFEHHLWQRQRARHASAVSRAFSL